jgi:N-formylglutamate amidohydrolase
MKIPENLIVLATHGSHTSPEVLKRHIHPDFNDRLQRNFSDFATTPLIKDIPEGQRVIPVHGRIAGDPNRAPDAPDLFRGTDFNGIPVYNDTLPVEVQNAALAESYHPYHAEIVRILNAQHGDIRNTLVAFDLHDTGKLLLGNSSEQDEDRETKTGWKMPPVIISNKDGLTAPEELMTDLKNAFVLHLGLSREDVKINDPYKGGYVTAHYGDPANPKLKEAKHDKRAVVQVELDRGLYVNEKTQEVIVHAIEDFRKKLTKVFAQVADGRTHHAR